jgi:pilus assembly protein Flp/PilA
MLKRLLARFARDESGATAIEYGMILSLMFLVILGALKAFGATGSGIINSAMDTLRAGMGG